MVNNFNMVMAFIIYYFGCTEEDSVIRIVLSSMVKQIDVLNPLHRGYSGRGGGHHRVYCMGWSE